METIDTQKTDSEVSKLNDESRNCLEDIQKYPIIKDDREYLVIAEIRKKIKDTLRNLEKTRKYLAEPILEAKRRLDSKFNEPKTRFAQAVGVADRVMLVYDRKIAAEKRDAERKAREEAKRKEEEEKKKLEKKAEKALDKGDEEGAQELINESENVYVPPEMPIEQEPTKPKGQSKRKVWKFKVIDPRAVPKQYWKLDESLIGKDVRALQERASIPGVRIWYEEIIIS